MAEKPGGSSSKDDDDTKIPKSRTTERDLPFQLRDVPLSTDSSAMRPPPGPQIRSRPSTTSTSAEDDGVRTLFRPSSSLPQSPSKEHHRGHTSPTSRVSSYESLPSPTLMSSPSKGRRVKDSFFPQPSSAPKIEVHTPSTESSSRLMGSSTTSWTSFYGGSTSPYRSSKTPSARTLSDVSSSIFDSSVTTHSSSSTLPSPQYDSSSSAQSGSDSESASGRSGSSQRSTTSLPTAKTKSHRQAGEPRKRRYSQSMSNIQSPPEK